MKHSSWLLQTNDNRVIFVDIYVPILIWNVVTMLVYGLDKLFARKGMRRISEKTLLSLAFMLGGIGAMFGMVVFNHKTSKHRFRFLVPLFVVINVVVFFRMLKIIN